MANQTNINSVRPGDKLKVNENNFPAFSTGRRSSRKSNLKENQQSDDLILSLSEAYENIRARQVTEWERRQNYSAGRFRLV